jgi:hypothetical protein
MSYLFTSSSFPKVRQEGFHTQQQQQSGVGTLGSGLGNTTGSGTGTPSQQSIPTPNAFDPNSIYTTGALFADAYRATQADPFARRYEQNQQQQQQQQNQQQQQSSSLDIHEELGFMHPPNSATSGAYQLSLAVCDYSSLPPSPTLLPTPTFSSISLAYHPLS